MEGPLKNLFKNATDSSFLEQLTPDPYQDKHIPNKRSREVFNGHYVFVCPTPLPKPELVIHSASMADELGLDAKACQSEDFLNFFSGHDTTQERLPAWATPYALSIYGHPMTSNCPFGTGNGYGDGRAITIAEVLLENGQRWDLQLKGAGTTPWCRGADGRAVLRSSVREFLASEAMFHLNVPTTRALSLIVSKEETVERRWYNKVGEEVSQQEQCAIVCRTSPSLLRIGHVELFARRVAEAQRTKDPKLIAVTMQELNLLLEHVIFREFAAEDKKEKDFKERIANLFQLVSERIIKLTTEWIRVGFCQGNFNSDNCLLGGRTMDYGPFGFIEQFSPLWCMWEGGGDKFGFMNQPEAGKMNFYSLVKSVWPKNKNDHTLLEKYEERSDNAICDMFATKLGLSLKFDRRIVRDLLGLLEECEADWTIFWRQLAVLRATIITDLDANNKATLMAPFDNTFYKVTCRPNKGFVTWLQRWAFAQLAEGRNAAEVATQMKLVSPKYIPREWMLVKAYTLAEKGDYSEVHRLHTLFKEPYAEQPDMEADYYQRLPEDQRKIGVTIMSCSS